jgi:hypothetical protein
VGAEIGEVLRAGEMTGEAGAQDTDRAHAVVRHRTEEGGACEGEWICRAVGMMTDGIGAGSGNVERDRVRADVV